MPTYIVLGKLTEQGIRNIKDSPKREDAFRNLATKAGAQVKDVYRTMGRYDVAAIIRHSPHLKGGRIAHSAIRRIR